jgi:hypothetical protein
VSHARRRIHVLTEPCTGPSCDRPARALGLCDSHYRQQRIHGRTFRLARYQRSSLPRSTTSQGATT